MNDLEHYMTATGQLSRENDSLKAEIKRLQGIITGAVAHSYGPYSDKELLHRVVVILKTEGGDEDPRTSTAELKTSKLE